jgi:hypothetical protein
MSTHTLLTDNEIMASELEKLADRARLGDFVGLALVTVTRDGNTGTMFCEVKGREDTTSLLGALRLLDFRLLSYISERP